MSSVVTAAEREDGTLAFQVQEHRDRQGQIVLTFTGELDHEANAVVNGTVGRLRMTQRDVVVEDCPLDCSSPLW